MIRNMYRTKLLRSAVIVSVIAVLIRAQPSSAAEQSTDMRALIQQALDQQVDITIEKQPLANAFKTIGQKTGVKLTIRPQVVELLPYGKETLVNAKIKNVSLRRGLSEMLDHLAMRLCVRDTDVAIEPVDPLRRICRQATWNELRQLHQMLATPYTPAALNKLQLHFQVRTSGDARKTLLAEAAKVGKGSMADVMEAACNQLGWTWYPSGDWIVILAQTEQAERFVDKPISLRYNHAALADVFADLARQADLRLRMEPGVLKGLPVETRQNFSLMMQQATIRTALEMISGATGLGYEVTPKEIVIKHTNASKAAATQPATVIRAHDPIVGEVSVGGKSGVLYKFFIRESDLSEELNKWRKQRISDTVKRMEQELKP